MFQFSPWRKKGIPDYSNQALYIFALVLLFNMFPKSGELPAQRSWEILYSGSSIFLIKSEWKCTHQPLFSQGLENHRALRTPICTDTAFTQVVVFLRTYSKRQKGCSKSHFLLLVQGLSPHTHCPFLSLWIIWLYPILWTTPPFPPHLHLNSLVYTPVVIYYLWGEKIPTFQQKAPDW